MNAPVRLLVHGASGRMGQSLLRQCADRDDCTVVAAVARSVGQRVVDGIPYLAPGGFEGMPAVDAIIDFSLPDAFDAILGAAEARGVAFVSGTTGLSDAQRAALDAAAGRIPVLWTANFSLGVALLGELVERAAAALPGWDCDIVEAHHVHKLDAPSGTALALGGCAQSAGASPRYASLRTGDIVGEHTVQFATAGERIELVHRATNRDIFARGALYAATRLVGRPPGRYRLQDLF